MNYPEALSYIKEKEKLGSSFGTDTIKELLRRLGNPETAAPAIHIAGTNGKGSIMAYVEETFVRTGMTVGRYISPTIYDYRERWTRNKEWASEEDVAESITAVSEKIEDMVADGMASPTAFEIETAVAFYLFKKWKCDIMLIECGMGGRLDATNVIEKDKLSVLASISMDHMEVLGKTVREITREKLGILRDRTVLVSYPQTPEVMAEISGYCALHNVKLIIADTDELVINEEHFYGSSFTYKGEDYDISIGGRYQIYNAITAIEVLKYFKDVCGDEIYSGLLTTRWDGRFSVVNDDPLVIVDGAHNEDAWTGLKKSLDKYFTNSKVIYIIGVLADKEYNKMIDILGPTAEMVFAVQSDSPRALAAEELSKVLTENGIDSVFIDVVEDESEIGAADETEVESADAFEGELEIEPEKESADGAERKSPDESLSESVNEKRLGLSIKKAMEIASKKKLPVVIAGTLSISGWAMRYFEERRA